MPFYELPKKPEHTPSVLTVRVAYSETLIDIRRRIGDNKVDEEPITVVDSDVTLGGSEPGLIHVSEF